MLSKLYLKHPRIAVILNTLILPILIPYGVFMAGVPAIWAELLTYPRQVRDAWRTKV